MAKSVVDELKVIITAEDKASSVFDKIGSGFLTLGKVAWAGAGAAIGAIAGMGIAVGKMSLDATVYASQRKAFGSMTEGIVGDIDLFLDRIADASAGTMSNAEIMSSALETFGMIGTDVFTDFEQNFADTITMARRTGRALGKDTQEVMDIITSSVATGNTMYLKRLGIQMTITDAQQAYADTLGKTVGELTEAEKKSAIYHMTMDRLGEMFGDVATTAGGLGTQLAQAKTWWGNLTTEIGMKAMPVMEELGGTLFPLVTSAVEGLLPYLDKALGFLQNVAEGFSFFKVMLDAGLEPLDALKAALHLTFGEEISLKVMEVIDKVLEFKDTVMGVVDPILKWVQENISLKDVLMGLGAAMIAVAVIILGPILLALGKVILVFTAVTVGIALLRNAWESDFGGIRTALTNFWYGTVEPVFQVLKEWLIINIPIAIGVLSDFWTNTLLPAILTVWAWVQDTLFPLFQDLWTWLQETIPMALDTLKTFWEDVLLPAIKDVWGFIQRDLVPLFEALWELIQVAGGLALTALQGLWENVLLPAIKDVWGFIETNLLPILSDLWSFISDKLIPKLDGVTGVFGDISGAIQGAIGWIGDLTTKLMNVKLPSFLTPGSPTPFEIGLKGIGSAMKELATVRMPDFHTSLAALPSPMGGGHHTTYDNRRFYNLQVEGGPYKEPIIDDFRTMEALPV